MSSSELSPIGETTVMLPTGEMLDTTDPAACAKAIDDLRELASVVRAWTQQLSRTVAEHAQNLGSLTFELDDGRKVEVSVRPQIVYDAEAIEEQLRAAGMPEETLAKIVKEEVTHTVVAVEAKKAARANEVYAQIIESNRTEHERSPSVSIRRR